MAILCASDKPAADAVRLSPCMLVHRHGAALTTREELAVTVGATLLSVHRAFDSS
jgi:hypothetical protein